MIDHVTIRVSSFEVSKRFYDAVFEPLGLKYSFGEDGVFAAYDVGQGCLFEIAQLQEKSTSPESPVNSSASSQPVPVPVATSVSSALMPSHIALRMKNHEQVDRFYELALQAGGKDNGKPGPRPQYTENYYACFVLDPDGHNIEAMVDKKLEKGEHSESMA